MGLFDRFRKNKYQDWDDEDDEIEEESQPASVSLEGNLDLKVVSPKTFEQLLSAVDHLAQGSTVLLTLEGIEKPLYRRMIDFISGAAYGLDASIKRATQDSFFIVPKDVDISGEIFDTSSDEEVFSDL